MNRQPHVVAQDRRERIDRGVEDGRIGIATIKVRIAAGKPA